MLVSLSLEPPAEYAATGLPTPVNASGLHLILKPEQPFEGFGSFDRSITQMLRTVRGHQVILDHDLATLYGVDTDELREFVGRRIDRFTDGSMFQLHQADLEQLNDRNLSSAAHALPFAFTETGVLIAAFVIGSSQARVVGSRIIDLFLRMRGVMFHYSDILLRLDQLEKRASGEAPGIPEVLDELKSLFDRPSGGLFNQKPDHR